MPRLTQEDILVSAIESLLPKGRTTLSCFRHAHESALEPKPCCTTAHPYLPSPKIS